jgi:hypothetical protein
MKVPNKGLSKEWRFQKVDKPDPGSYEVEEAERFTSTKKTARSVAFSKMPNKRFSEIISDSK